MTRLTNPDFAEAVCTGIDKLTAMHLIRATLPVVEQEPTEIRVPHRDGIERQHGFVHEGVVGMLADSSAGYAATTMVLAGASVPTVEYKMNIVAPADGEKLIARGQVGRYAFRSPTAAAKDRGVRVRLLSLSRSLQVSSLQRPTIMRSAGIAAAKTARQLYFRPPSSGRCIGL